VREDVTLKVVDLDEWDVVGNRETFGERYTYEERAKKTWTTREGDGVNLIDAHAGLLECGVNYGNNILLMSARCQLRNHAAILLVHCL
jgi:hypothetical protein